MNLFLTGGTGFLGEYLLTELLGRGHTVYALHRRPERRDNTLAFLRERGTDTTGRLTWLEGNLLDIADLWPRWRSEVPGFRTVDNVLHAAASLRFNGPAQGDPYRTNVRGAEILRGAVAGTGVKVHAISTAYVCGQVGTRVVSEVNHPAGRFGNDYEASKWRAEQVWTGEATLLRPGIIIGDTASGRCTSFTGWYVFIKAADMFGNYLRLLSPSRRRLMRFTVPVDRSATAGLNPVDWVARSCVRLIEDPANHGRIFHLTHPHPPTNEWMHGVVCRRFGITNVRLDDAGRELEPPGDAVQRVIYRHIRMMRPYMANCPIFDRTNTDAALPDVPTPEIDEKYLNMVIDYALANNLGAP